MYKKILCCLLLFMNFVLSVDGADKKFTLVIDPGHGGNDTGAPGAFSKEKTINLNVALAFGRYVEQNCPDVKVIYTRKTDVFIPLHKRADIANRNKADVFISIHTNSVASRSPVRGMETYTMGMRRSDEKLSAAMRENEVIVMEDNYQQHYGGYDPRSPESLIMFEIIHDKNMSESVELAKLIQKHTCATAGRPNKGVKQDVFLVLRETSMPACLVELGYITTPDEERYLNNRVNIDAMGRGIYQAFVAYKKKRTEGINVPYKPGFNPKDEQPKQVETPPAVEEKVEPQAEEKPQQAEESQPKQEEKAEPQPVRQAEEKSEMPIGSGKSTADVPRTNPWAKKDNSDKPEEQTAKQEEQPVKPVEQPTKPVEQPVKPVEQPASTSTPSGVPVFKVQILASAVKLKSGSAQLKGCKDAAYYQEGGLYKYTVGASADYNEINRLRRSLAGKFPQAFVIAFRDGVKMDVRDAIQEFMAKRGKK